VQAAARDAISRFEFNDFVFLALSPSRTRACTAARRRNLAPQQARAHQEAGGRRMARGLHRGCIKNLIGEGCLKELQRASARNAELHRR
jgi:hypothetical protein